jgi:putative membrane protein
MKGTSMKNKLIAGAAITMAMTLSHAFETPQTGSPQSGARIILAQTAILKSDTAGESSGQSQAATGQQSGEKQEGAEAAKLDRKFAQKAIHANAVEIQTGEYASQKATHDKVKEFGQRMYDDHSKANEQLMSVINDTIPEKWRPIKELDVETKKQIEKLNKTSEKEFDRAFMNMMVKSHKDAIDLYEKETKNGKNEKLKQYAEKTLPTLKEHLKMAQDIQKQL